MMQNSSGKVERIRNLEHGNGIQYLLHEAYEIFGNPTLVHDMEYKTIAVNREAATDDPIFTEYVATGTVSNDWLEFFKDECFIEEAANAKTITFLTSDKLKYNRIFGKLFNGNNVQIGCAVMLACNRSFDYDDPMLFEEFCAVLSAEFGKDDFYNEYGQAYSEKLVGALLEDLCDTALYAAHVESMYMHLKTNIYLAVVDTGESDPTHERLVYLRDLLKKTQPEYMYAIHAGYVLIIISTDDPVLYVEKDLSRLDGLFAQHNMVAGISRSFENLFDLRKYYEEALGLLHSGAKKPGQRIFLPEQS